MSLINPIPNDRVRYTLSHPNFGSVLILEPEGWDTDEKEFSRNKDYHGIFTKFSNSLKFSGDAADFIRMIDDSEGINATPRLTKEERHPITDRWTKSYDGFLDLSTIEEEGSTLAVKFNAGGLEPILKARESESVELERLTTMDNKTIDPLKVDKVALDGRRILLISKWETRPDTNTATISLSSNGNTRDQTVGVPLDLISKSHEEAQTVTPESFGDDNHGSLSIIIIAVVDRPRTFRVKLEITFTTNVIRYDDVNHGWYGLYLGKYGDQTDYNLVDRVELFKREKIGGGANGFLELGGMFGEFNPTIIPPQTFTVTYDQNIYLDTGQSLSLEFWGHADLGSNLSRGHLDIKAQNIKSKVTIIEDSFYEKSRAKFVLMYEAFERLTEIITGNKNNFKSKFYGRTELGYAADGPGALTGITHGFWIRGFDALPAGTDDDPNPFKPLTTSFKDCEASSAAIWNTGLGIERNGYKETIIVEDLRYFYNPTVTVRLPNQISKAKRTKATDNYFSGVEVGYEKGGSYDEAMGLDEYNGKTTFSTVITRLKSVYSSLSKYRADSYGKEFARRKPKFRYPTVDTQYDDEIFVMDLKRGPMVTETVFSGLLLNQTQSAPFRIYQERLWQDDFETQPTGTYSPETATNLRLSPVNNLWRHAWYIAAGLTKYPMDYLMYGSSTANSNLQTKLVNEDVRTENGNILNGHLKRARFVAEKLEFEHVCDFGVMQQIEGRTIVNGEEIQNVYGLIEFTNENGLKEKGWLMNLKPNGSGKFEILTFNSTR